MTARGRIAVAVLVSVAAHGLVVSGEWVPVVTPRAPHPPLVARLETLPQAKPVTPRPRVPAPRRAAPAPPIETVAAATPLGLPPPLPDAAPAETVAEQAVAPDPPPVIALAPVTTAPPPQSLPRRGRISYSLVYGDDRAPVGRVVQTWEADGATYRLSSEAETTGVVELFRPQRLRYESRGSVTGDGLRPDSFRMSRTRRGQDEAAQARFDWAARELAFGNPRAPRTAPLAAGAQDFMSFLYHYAVVPPAPGRHQVPITTGTRFEVYDIEIGEEVFIETPLGRLRALPVRQLPRPGMESIEIWLATEYRHLPVRVRHYDREGRPSGEQIVSEIRISEE